MEEFSSEELVEFLKLLAAQAGERAQHRFISEGTLDVEHTSDSWFSATSLFQNNSIAEMLQVCFRTHWFAETDCMDTLRRLISFRLRPGRLE
jgi:hypothetical protein